MYAILESYPQPKLPPISITKKTPNIKCNVNEGVQSENGTNFVILREHSMWTFNVFRSIICRGYSVL